IGEETGLIGIAVVITLFAVLICRGFMIAFRVPDLFGSLLASGLTILIGMEAFINIAGVMGLVPTKGMALPFVSYGGTSLFMSLALVGILLNLSTYQKSNFREAPK
ncbi:MAG: FtsW/RodA/SpoVE family cell cycle protein, partial [Deltaproteobacteria bacterium]|nr:FtsW/RodA/SpoVE family cell cycle protein [Deltaproteobacteria bacterium]